MRGTLLSALIALGVALAAALLPFLRRSHGAPARTLLRTVVALPDPKTAEPREHVGTAGRFAIIGIALWGLAFSVFSIADRWLINSTPNTVISTIGLFFMFFGLWVWWHSFKQLRHSWRARQRSASQRDAGSAT